MSLPPDLAAYLRRQAGTPFRRPDADCCFLAVDWIVVRAGIDVAPDLRGAYRTATQALRLIQAWGGFEAMWRQHMARAPFTQTERPEPGDVGVLRDHGGQIIAGIRVPGAWACKTTRGLLIEDLPMRCAWSLVRG